MSDLKGTTVTWLGHATVLVTTAAGTTILIDPFLEHNPTYPKGFPLPERLDLILLTHGHADHTADALPAAKRTGAPIVAMFELAKIFERQGAETMPLGYGGSLTHKDVTITMTQARHSSGVESGDGFIYGAEPAGYVLEVKDGPVLYHAGDTDVFLDMQLIREMYCPEIGMLPIGGTFTMGPRGAAKAAELLGLSAILPLHFGTFPMLKGTPAALEEHLGDVGVQVLRLEPGQSVR